MTLEWISNLVGDPTVLDEETWDAPRRLSRDDLYAESGSSRRAAWPEDQEA